MPKLAGGGSKVSGVKKQKILSRALKGPNTKPGPAARSKVVVTNYPKAAKKALSAGATRKPTLKKATNYLVKSSGTTKGEVKGVMKALRSGEMSKGGAIKALKGGPKAGVPAGNRKRVARAIRKAR